MSKLLKVFVGIDISKTYFDAAIEDMVTTTTTTTPSSSTSSTYTPADGDVTYKG